MTQPAMLDPAQWAAQNGYTYDPAFGQWSGGGDSAQQGANAYQAYVNDFNAGGGAYTDAYAQGGQLPGEGYVAPSFSDLKGAGLYGANQAATLYGQGPVTQEFGQDSLAAQDQIRTLAGQNTIRPAIKQAQHISTGYNPFTSQFNQFQGQQNVHLDQMFNQGADQIQDRMNSMFSAAGRTGSNQHAKTTGQALTDFGTKLYGSAFDSMQNRNLQAIQGGQSGYNANANTQLNAIGQMPGLNQAQFYNPMMLQTSGAMQDDQAYDNAMGGWNNLNNFTSTIAGMSGVVPQPKDKVSNFDRLLGAASVAAPFFMGG